MKLGLTSFQYSMLAHLESEGPLTFAELAAREHVSSGDVQRSLVVPIVLDGLVTETDHVGSDVASYASTPAGSRAVQRTSGPTAPTRRADRVGHG